MRAAQCAHGRGGRFEIARRSRGTPRIANRLLRRVRDYAEVRGDGRITKSIADKALAMLDVDPQGFDVMDRKLLEAVIHRFDGGPVGLDNIAASIGEEAGTIEDVIEPYLIQQGYLQRTPRGRIATLAAFRHLGVAPPQAAGGLFSSEQNVATGSQGGRVNRRWLVWALGAAVLLAAVAMGATTLRGPQVDALVVQSAPLVRTLQFSARVATLSRVDVGSTVTGRGPGAGDGGHRGAPGRCAGAARIRRIACRFGPGRCGGAPGEGARLEGLQHRAAPPRRPPGRKLMRHCKPPAPAWRRCSSWWPRFYSPRSLTRHAGRWTWQAQQLGAQAQLQATADAGTEVAQAQAQLALAQAATVAAQARLAQTTLVAPADARVLVREPGAWADRAAGQGPAQPGAGRAHAAGGPGGRAISGTAATGPAGLGGGDAFAGSGFAARVLSIAPGGGCAARRH